MFSKWVNTIKNVLNTAASRVVPFLRRSGIAMVAAGRFVAVSVVAACKTAVAFFSECIGAFVKSVKGYFALLKQFFAIKKQNGFKAAFQAHTASLLQVRRRYGRLLSRCAVIAIPMAFMVLVGVTAPVWANFTFAKRVVYAKTVLGEILDEKIYESAKKQFVASVGGNDGASYLEEYKLNTVYVMKNRVLTAEALAEQMLDNTKTLFSGYGLYVDEELVLASEDAVTLYSNLYRLLNESKNGNDTAQASFLQNIEVKDGYYPTTDCADAEAVNDAFAQNTLQLSVKTTVIEEYDESIPYSVNKTNSNSLTAGKTKVVKKGKNGTNHITANVTYIDGVETERVITDTQVVSQPVTQQVLVGTKKAAPVKSSKVMVWPIAASAHYVITSPFNEERSTHAHGGLDIACDKGTAIYAAMAGTVTVAKNSGSYGKHIMIDHGSNIVTVYAHCSALYVTVGDKVVKGEHIAAVGNTGRSTGNHLHFEVRINGKKYNPLNYVNK